MGIQRSLLIGGPANVTYNSATFHSKEDIRPKPTVDWVPVTTSLFGPVDKVSKDRRIEIPVRLWGAWENLTTLFPAAFIGSGVYAGYRIFGTADKALVLSSPVTSPSNTNILTFPNAAVTKMANLHLGVDASIYSADVNFTALIKNGANPEDVGAYWVWSTGAYSDSTFSKTNFHQQRYTAAWGSVAGFTSFQARDGWDIEWELTTEPDPSNSFGTVGLIVTGLICRASCIPIGPTPAQLDAASDFGTVALGTTLSTGSADLVISGDPSGPSVTLKNAGITEHEYAFGMVPLRVGKVTWETTLGFSAGAAAAHAVLA